MKIHRLFIGEKYTLGLMHKEAFIFTVLGILKKLSWYFSVSTANDEALNKFTSSYLIIEFL